MIFGFIAAAGGAVVGWQQLGGPLPASQAYVRMVQSESQKALKELTRDMDALRAFGVDSRMVILGQKLSDIRREQIELEQKMKEEPPSKAMIRLTSELSDQAYQIEGQIKALELQIKR